MHNFLTLLLTPYSSIVLLGPDDTPGESVHIHFSAAFGASIDASYLSFTSISQPRGITNGGSTRAAWMDGRPPGSSIQIHILWLLYLWISLQWSRDCWHTLFSSQKVVSKNGCLNVHPINHHIDLFDVSNSYPSSEINLPNNFKFNNSEILHIFI